MFLCDFLVMTSSGARFGVDIEEDARLNSVDAIHYFEYLQHITSSSPVYTLVMAILALLTGLRTGVVSCWVSAWWLVSASFLPRLYRVCIWGARLSYHTPTVNDDFASSCRSINRLPP